MAYWVQDPQSGIGTVTLPMGVLTEEGELLNTVTLREMSGREEQLLASDDMDIADRIGSIIRRCVLSVGAIEESAAISALMEKMPSGDREAVLFALRALSMGNVYQMEVSCERCGNVDQIQVDMSDLEYDPPEKPEERVFTIDMPAGCEISLLRWEVMTVARERLQQKLRKPLDNDIFTIQILCRLLELDGEEIKWSDKRSYMAAAAKIVNLRARHRDFIRTEFNKHEGGVDTTVEWRCSNCRAGNKGRMDPGQVGFFFPSGVSRR